MRAMSTKRRIGFVVFDGITALDLIGPLEAFACAAGGTGGPAYELVTLGLSQRRCVAESGVRIVPDLPLAAAPALDTLIVPGGSGLREPRNAPIAEWLGARARRIRRVASVCTGIYALARAGLLDGRRATTHWRFAGDVVARFPRVRLEPNAVYVKDGRFYTSAGVTAGIDLALAMIEEDLGAAAALAVARELVVYLKRPGGQAQFSEPLEFQARASGGFNDLVGYVAGHLRGDLSVEALADAMHLSPRQFSRRCRAELATSPAVLVERIRLDAARSRLVERGSHVGQVAASVGFRSADVFRRAFERRFGVNPTAYRARFAAEAGAEP
jgi:transcriptional regulator GlxA family with amidase domain